MKFNIHIDQYTQNSFSWFWAIIHVFLAEQLCGAWACGTLLSSRRNLDYSLYTFQQKVKHFLISFCNLMQNPNTGNSITTKRLCNESKNYIYIFFYKETFISFMDFLKQTKICGSQVSGHKIIYITEWVKITSKFKLWGK